MIEGGNFFDLREEAVVDLLNVGAGERAGLGGGEAGESGDDCQKKCGFHSSPRGAEGLLVLNSFVQFCSAADQSIVKMPFGFHMVLALWGSFDYACTTLRVAHAPLRMTSLFSYGTAEAAH